MSELVNVDVESDLSQAIVEIKDVTFSRGERTIYKNMSFCVPKGKITAIMGPSGIGKTTMLRLIGGQLKPDSGDILFEGQSIPSMSRKALYDIRTKMSMLFQSGALFTDMSVFDNIAFPLREHTQLSEELIRLVVLMKLQAVGLRGAKDLMPSELSGGMARRAALARSIALDPELIMYDEPFAGQDPISMGVLVKLIKSLNEVLGISSLIVTHDVNEVLSIADHVVIIAEQGVIGSGTPEQMQQHDSALVQQFLKGLSDGPVPFHYKAQNYQEELLSGSQQ
ncbi:Intermembrane phospholipid transport system ATP-binding protein MlaF [Pseudoalteromonas holothuriae]|uniref:Intermembrane phospholipid transport system ATP-binding protein MlaF n=1 Tax=Pseudoalteromonas holothuriae TaxID=2963714 RepID=A0A9W4R274_9GAMM|nr:MULTISPECIES: ATP-binding cassette domain-containing protein [unclassified Pseudoalteromonas]CAH9063334.1 Intermembrane phospholipid transport system ATP-binding protein MlaF [Pseudoalteromonas sp. CIP111854]CAH9065026.1 Intermembrane phospholipid transport system ATP-binding protein MlaF [Pseudoalteromonas sp. CIP111951]